MVRRGLIIVIIAKFAHAWNIGQPMSFPLSTRLRGYPNEQQQNPCWGDLYDDDCAMSNIYAASFVASEWIRSMPCASGVEDCDVPKDLTVPETRPEACVEQVDVMSFLGLSRTPPIDIPNTSASDAI